MLWFTLAHTDIVAAAVLSANRNFEGRVNPLTRANYLASPPLVVAYALAGTVSTPWHAVVSTWPCTIILWLTGTMAGKIASHASCAFSIRLTLTLRKSPLELERVARKFS